MLLQFIPLPEGQPVKLGDGHAEDLVELFLGQVALQGGGRRQREQLEDVRCRLGAGGGRSGSCAFPLGTLCLAVSDPWKVYDEYLLNGSIYNIRNLSFLQEMAYECLENGESVCQFIFL